jgi:hypothetical protein
MGQDTRQRKDNPYSALSASKYWKSGVAERHFTELEDLYQPKFVLGPGDRIAVAGSCFAQHVGKNLKAQGFKVLDREKAPKSLSDEVAQKFGYRTYSARYGNIYTARQLVQLIKDSSAGVAREEDFWWRGDRVFDALRPNVEPDGYESLDEAVLHRKQHLSNVQSLFAKTDVLIFTLGLTEAWEDINSGTVFPTCPGVIAGEFDDSKYRFVNYDYSAVLADMIEVHTLLKAINPEMKFLLTVSPVPLTATASGQHVLVATTYSKSVLRAVCGAMTSMFDDVDYFPSYEIIASPPARGFFYEPNLRSVNRNGVAHVMSQFLKAHSSGGVGLVEPAPSDDVEEDSPREKRGKPKARRKGDVVCEEELLEAFAQ